YLPPNASTARMSMRSQATSSATASKPASSGPRRTSRLVMVASSSYQPRDTQHRHRDSRNPDVLAHHETPPLQPQVAPLRHALWHTSVCLSNDPVATRRELRVVEGFAFESLGRCSQRGGCWNSTVPRVARFLRRRVPRRSR